MKNIKKRLGSVLIIIGSLLVLTSAGLFVWNYYMEKKAVSSMEEEVAMLEASIKDSDSDEGEENLEEALKKNMPVVMLDGYDYIGYLNVPSMDLKLPVLNTYDNEKLKIAVCRYYGSLETDDLVLAGHNYEKALGKIKSIELGDKIIFTNMNGEDYTYIVKETEILNPTQVEDMVESKYDLSIYTCTYSGKARFTVRLDEME